MEISCSFSLVTIVVLFFFYCQSSNALRRGPLLNNSANASAAWATAGATWYGSPDGYGSDGGACGYGPAVGQPPFSSMVTAGNPNLFKSGEGCGSCYQVKCNQNELCSRAPVTVVITDECPGGLCLAESVHFDLSGAAFGAMALPGRAQELLNVGTLQVEFARVACDYPGYTVTFHVDGGSNPNYFAVLIEYEDGDGDLSAVSLREDPSTNWISMQQSWGAVWKLNSGWGLKGPFSIKMTTLSTGKTVVAENVIPCGWVAGGTYRSIVNFNVS